jgi:SOS-response transcriptional repressor LexA
MSLQRDAEKDRAAVRFIQSYAEEHGYPPTMREVAEGIGVALSTSQWRVQRLIEDGHLARPVGRARALLATESGRRLIEEGRAEL